MTLTTERLKWLHDATTELSATKLKMTMRPDELLVLTSELLANREAQPVVEPYMYELWKFDETAPELERWFLVERSHSKLVASKGQKVVLLYTAPPAPAVPPEATPENIENLLADITLFFTAGSLSHGGSVMFAEVWNACRAAMLNGGKS